MMKNILFGNEIERMPDFVFRIMKVLFIIYYFFRPAGKYLQKFGIKPGSVVVDYGCGPGSCIRDASMLTGEAGMVYAVDIHEMAIDSVEELIRKHSLKNVRTILTDGNSTSLPDEAADLILRTRHVPYGKGYKLFSERAEQNITEGWHPDN